VINRILGKQTLASFDFQWKELPTGGALASDRWFDENVAGIIAEELLCLSPDWFAGRSVLDAGCGSGRWTIGLLRLGARVTAVDASPHALERCRESVESLCTPEEAARLTLREVDLLRLPDDLTSRRFDCVFSFGVLHHTGATREAFENVAALVEPGGVIFLYLYGKESFSPAGRILLELRRLVLAPLPFRAKKALLSLLYRKKDVHQIFDLLSPVVNARHSFDEVEEWLHGAGFRDVLRTIPHAELFIRAARDPAELSRFALPTPEPPYWFERYAGAQTAEAAARAETAPRAR
jgi:SAM-dependent methyltransferase